MSEYTTHRIRIGLFDLCSKNMGRKKRKIIQNGGKTKTGGGKQSRTIMVLMMAMAIILRSEWDKDMKLERKMFLEEKMYSEEKTDCSKIYFKEKTFLEEKMYSEEKMVCRKIYLKENTFFEEFLEEKMECRKIYFKEKRIFKEKRKSGKRKWEENMYLKGKMESFRSKKTKSKLRSTERKNKKAWNFLVPKLKLNWKLFNFNLEEVKLWWENRKVKNKNIKMYNGNGKSTIKIVSWNLGSRGWTNKTLDIQHFFEDFTPDIGIISEANLFTSSTDKERVITGYRLVLTKKAATSDSACSRLVVLLREGLNLEILEDKMEQDISTIWMKFGRRGHRPIIIGAIYREHQLLGKVWTKEEGEQVYRWNKILDQWTGLDNGAQVIVYGDINLDKLKWSNPEQINSQMVEGTKNRIETNGFSQLVTGATRFWPNTVPSLVDQVWSNSPQIILKCRNVERAVADHNVVETTVRIKGKVNTPKESLQRNWKSLDVDKFRKEIEDIDWNKIYSLDEINIAYYFLEENLLRVLDSMIPIRKVKHKNKRKGWVSNETKQTMKLRDETRSKAAETNSAEDWSNYRKLRNLCSKKVKTDKNTHFKNLYETAETKKDIKSLYRITKEQLGWNSGGPPSSFIIQGKLTNKPKEVAEHQMEYFDQKLKKLKDDLPYSATDPLKTLREAMERWEGADQRPEMQIREITPIDTLNIIKSLGNSTCMSNDGLDSNAIKLVTTTLYNPITHIVNLSIKTGKFSNKWKVGKLIPLHKGGGLSQLVPSSYRPISILPVIGKIVERAVQNQVISYMEKTHQFNKSHHAYRTMHNTTTAALQMTDYIAQAADEGLISQSMLIDQSAAFDCLNHVILDQKLKMYNFSQHSRAWFRDYLDRRSQYVSVGASRSTIREVVSGVPQGSILGPVMYTIYTNELPETTKNHRTCLNQSHQSRSKLFGEECKKCGMMTCYADDSTFVTAQKTRPENQVKIIEKLETISDFMTSNQLSINQSKTQLIEHMVKQKRAKQKTTPPELNITMNNGEKKKIENSKYCRLLGLNIQNDLSWKTQIESGAKALIPTLRKRLGCLKRVGQHIPRSGKLVLANGLLLSKIIYMLPVWGGGGYRKPI